MSDYRKHAVMDLSMDDLDQVSGGMELGDLYQGMFGGTTVLAANSGQAADSGDTVESFCMNCGKITKFRCGYSGGRGICKECGTPKDL